MQRFDEFFLGDQHPMYVQRWSGSPQTADAARDVIFVHGGAHTGACWTTTPDGRPGWAPLFADAGHASYVVDWPGIGRSRRGPHYAQEGPTPTVEALATLIDTLNNPILIGHSFGAPLAVKAADLAQGPVAALVLIAPSAPGNVRRTRELLPTDHTVFMTREDLVSSMAGSDRFPKQAMDRYWASITDFSPSIGNAIGDGDDSGALVATDLEAIRAIPSLVLGADQDYGTSEEKCREIADALSSDLIRVSEDWGLSGFGHMLPIELGTELVAARVIEWIAARLS